MTTSIHLYGPTGHKIVGINTNDKMIITKSFSVNFNSENNLIEASPSYSGQNTVAIKKRPLEFVDSADNIWLEHQLVKIETINNDYSIEINNWIKKVNDEFHKFIMDNKSNSPIPIELNFNIQLVRQLEKSKIKIIGPTSHIHWVIPEEYQ